MADYLTLAITIIGSLGGIEALKLILYRNTNRQKEAISVVDANLNVTIRTVELLKGQIEHMNTLLKERSGKIDSLYLELRSLQEERIKHIQLIERAKYWKCYVKGCNNRKPPHSETEEIEE